MWSTPIKTSFTEDERLPLFLSQLIPEDSFVVTTWFIKLGILIILYLEFPILFISMQTKLSSLFALVILCSTNVWECTAVVAARRWVSYCQAVLSADTVDII